MWDWRGITSSAAGLESRRLVFRHQAKNARSATSALAWVDHESGVPSGFLRKRDVALVGLQHRERDVGGPAHASQLGPGGEGGQPVGVVDERHVRVVVGRQPLQPVGGDGGEAVGVGRVAGDGEGVLAAAFGLRTPRAHCAAAPTPTTPSSAASCPAKCPQGRPIGQKEKVSSLLVGGFWSLSEGRPIPDR